MDSIQELLNQIDEFDQLGFFNDALKKGYEAFNLANSLNDQHYLLESQLRIARALSKTGGFTESNRIANEILQTEKNSSLASCAYILLGRNASETDQISKAENYLRQAIAISRSIRDQNSLSRALHNMATAVHAKRGQFSLALSTMDEASALISEKGGGHWGGPYLRANINLLLGNRQRVRAALDEFVPMIKPGGRIAGIYYYLWACLSVEDGEFEKAEEYLRLSLRIADQINSYELDTRVRCEYSRMFRLRGNLPESRSWAEDAVKSSALNGFLHSNALALIERGITYMLSDYEKLAEQDFIEAEKILNQVEDHYHLAKASLFKAVLHLEQDHADARTEWLSAVEKITDGGYSFILERERIITFPIIVRLVRSHNKTLRASAENVLEQLSLIPPTPLTVMGLGQFSVWQGHRRIPDQVWHRRKAGELFRYLLLRPDKSVGREEILEDIWPDSPPAAGQDLLHQATSALRRILEPDLPDKFPSRYLIVEGERIFLKLPPSSQIDFDNFLREMPAAIQSGDFNQLKYAVSLYVDELFPMDRYKDWSSGYREQLTTLLHNGLLQLGKAYFQRELFFDAINCAKGVLKLDPWSEDAALLAMQAYIHLNEHPRALHIYGQLQKTLKEDLDIAPRADLRSLAEQVRNR